MGACSRLLLDTVPPASRALWSGAESGLWLGWCLATGLGGALTDAFGFQAAFGASAALLLLGAVSQLPLLRLAPNHGRTVGSGGGSFDDDSGGSGAGGGLNQGHYDGDCEY